MFRVFESGDWVVTVAGLGLKGKGLVSREWF